MEEGKGGAGMSLDGNIFNIEEFNFPHAIALHETALKVEPLISTYKKLYMTLGLDKHPGTVLINF